MTRVEVVEGGKIKTFTGTFKATLRVTDRLFDSWFYLRFVKRIHYVMVEGAEGAWAACEMGARGDRRHLQKVAEPRGPSVP